MHFVGMSALSVEEPGTGRMVSINYDLPYTVLSLALVLLLASAGLVVASYDRVFTKTKREITQMFVAGASNMTMGKIMKLSPFQLVCLIAYKSPQHLVGGGLLAAVGVCIMHYVGMAAMRFPGRIVWDYGVIVASVVIAFLASTAAFWILFRLLSIFPSKELLRVASSVMMAIAVCGMHYTGMLAASFEFDDTVDPCSSSSSARCISSHQVYAAGFGVALLLSFFFVLILFCDLRFAVHRLSAELARADDLVLTLNMVMGRNSRGHAQVQHYLRRRRLQGVGLAADKHSAESSVIIASGLGGFGSAKDDTTINTETGPRSANAPVNRPDDGSCDVELDQKSECSISFIASKYRANTEDAGVVWDYDNDDAAVNARFQSDAKPMVNETAMTTNAFGKPVNSKIYPIEMTATGKQYNDLESSIAE